MRPSSVYIIPCFPLSDLNREKLSTVMTEREGPESEERSVGTDDLLASVM